MSASHQHNYVHTYEEAAQDLTQAPNDQDLQHKAVLALARAGSTKFALAEYSRYGLHKVRQHEDIMSLGARLSKDLYLATTGKEALENARDSAHKYEAAFKDTKGFYSGVNAATMALVARMPREQVTDRAKTILSILPKPENLTSEEHYFIEATRAECFLLLEQYTPAKANLRSAVAHDPLNYTAHASTLKQFAMILQHQNQPSDWLQEFIAPQAIYFAGHIFGASTETSGASRQLSPKQIEALKVNLSDIIQKNDIGFAYGALAAGSDIIIAEALLDEGVELNVVLPTNEKQFFETSVKPFGASWEARFKHSLDAAHSVMCLSASADWPSCESNQISGQITMGKAVMRSQSLSTGVAQLLIWDEASGGSYTSTHAKDWTSTNRPSLIVPLLPSSDVKPKTAQTTATSPTKDTKHEDISINLCRKGASAAQGFNTVMDAAQSAFKIQDSANAAPLGLHLNIGAETEAPSIASMLANASFSNSIAASENFASVLAFHDQDEIYKIQYAGKIKSKIKSGVRAYSLSKRNKTM